MNLTGINLHYKFAFTKLTTMISNEINRLSHQSGNTSPLSGGGIESNSKRQELTCQDVKRFVAHCDLALSQTEIKDMRYYSSVALCALDAVFSIRARYYAVVSPLVDRACSLLNIPRFYMCANRMPSEEGQITVSDFKSKLNCTDPNELAELLNNRQRTSTKSGILKADAFIRYLDVFTDLKVNTYQDVNRKVDEINPRLRQIPGQNVSVDYFFMLAGNTDDVKVDKRINSFVYDAIGRNVPPEQVKDLFRSAVQYYRKGCYPYLTVRMLDHTVWSWQRKCGMKEGKVIRQADVILKVYDGERDDNYGNTFQIIGNPFTLPHDTEDVFVECDGKSYRATPGTYKQSDTLRGRDSIRALIEKKHWQPGREFKCFFYVLKYGSHHYII